MGASLGKARREDGSGGLPEPGAHCTEAVRKQIAWGVATASYQVEGGWNEGGRAPSVWDTFAHAPGNVRGGDTGDVACDCYHNYEEDFALMQQLGVRHYRFSVSWSRVLPQGAAGSPVNEEGVRYYQALVRSMRARGVEPYVTIFHWDLPQALQDSYGGFPSERIVADFEAYASLLFERLGAGGLTEAEGGLGPELGVRHWITFNEPWITCSFQYGEGIFAPGVATDARGTFACARHVLLAHARVKKLHDERFKARAGARGSKVAIALNIEWLTPLNPNKPEDVAAAQLGVERQLGWFADPLVFGQYPASMLRCSGSGLVPFTEDEAALLRGSLDALAINFYTSKYAAGDAKNPCHVETHDTDLRGRPIGKQAQSFWLRVTPWGIRSILRYVHERYAPKEIWMTENGVSAPGEAAMTDAKAARDAFRVNFYRDYLDQVCRAVAEDGVPLSHYFAWSFLDNFEWKEGYSERFGIVRVDFNSPERTRTVKDSARFLSRHFFSVGK